MHGSLQRSKATRGNEQQSDNVRRCRCGQSPSAEQLGWFADCWVEVSTTAQRPWTPAEGYSLLAEGTSEPDPDNTKLQFWSRSRPDNIANRTRNLSWCSWDARQHRFNFVRRLSWSISSQFRRSSLLKCVWQPEIAKKNHNKALFLVVQGRSRSSMLAPPERSSAVLVMICSKFVSICNCSHARRANSGK